MILRYIGRRNVSDIPIVRYSPGQRDERDRFITGAISLDKPLLWAQCRENSCDSDSPFAPVSGAEGVRGQRSFWFRRFQSPAVSKDSNTIDSGCSLSTVRVTVSGHVPPFADRRESVNLGHPRPPSDGRSNVRSRRRIFG